MPILIPSDLLPFAPTLDNDKAEALIAGTVARTALFVPGVNSDGFAYSDAARDLLSVAVLRRIRSEGGLVTTEVVGPYQVTVDNSSLVAGGLYTAAEMAEWGRIVRGDSDAPSVPVALFAFPDAPSCWPDPALPHPVVWRV